jgi:uncharacterized Zn-binding protein involved in type VI secretion
MPSISRLGDKCTGHGCFPPRVNDEASGDVFVNGIGVHRVGDHWVVHVCGTSSHDSTASSGSGTVFANGKAVMRIGDSVACGSAVAQGSGNVFAG